MIGTLLVAFAIIKFLWDRRRGGGNLQVVMWTLVVGALLAAPGALIPLLLGLAEAVVNVVISLVDAIF